MLWLLLIALPVLLLVLAWRQAGALALLLSGLVWIAAFGLAAHWGVGLTVLVLLGFGAVMAALLHQPTRQRWLSAPLMSGLQQALPQMSATERDALEAGTVWWEGELFRGRPDWTQFAAYSWPQLSAAEQAFLDQEVNALCALSNDWAQRNALDMPPAVWEFIRSRGFLGLIIPESYGGKGFSAYAHSQIITRLATRASAPAVTVMVPNSLGPAELLLRYGTEAQKNHYLPRLARGEEIPAFALTSPWAGSDAAAIPDTGIVCRGRWQGEEVLGMRVSFDKRYITLAPVCTVFGLAFHLHDPDGLLGGQRELGITCALVPHDHPGVDIGRRHWPLNAAWMNGPVRGQDVFMPLDFVIGGPARIGQGWRMLMECLAAGRSISLPGSAVGMQQLCARSVGAYARVRSQFRTPIGHFEGVEEALARIAGNTYLSDAARVLSCAALDAGEQPAVVSAIVKSQLTERARVVVNAGMDVLGGKGICLGPNNFLAAAYDQLPVGITVEGANILTRSLILFGQGALRCHPYAHQEIEAARAGQLAVFDQLLWQHVGYALHKAARALVMGLSGARLAQVPIDVAPEMRRYYQQLSRFSAAFACIADASLATLGAALKRREKLSARLGDILALLYLASAALKRYEAEGRQAADAPLVHWAVRDCLFQIQLAFEGVLANFPNPLLATLLRRLVVFPLGHPYSQPSDALGHQVARVLLSPSPTRERLTAAVHRPQAAEEPLAALEAALQATLAVEGTESRLRQAVRAGQLPATATEAALWQQAVDDGVISAAEHEQLQRRKRLHDAVIAVDDFAAAGERG